MEKKPIGAECRFAIHIPTNSPDIPDVHLIKEVLHFEDGSTKPNITFKKNYQRKFWLTKPSYRNHKDKKEFEEIEKLLEFETTQSEMRFKIVKALDKVWSNESIKDLGRSPYLYGTDITSTALIKAEYMNKYPELRTGYSVAVYDIETDVVNGTEEIILATIVFKNKIVTAANKSFIKNSPVSGERVYSAFERYLGEYKKDMNLEFEFLIAENAVEVVRAVYTRAHEWMPDFIAIWNMDFDIPKTIKTIEEAGIDPEDILGDPRIPKIYRRCRYKEGRKKKITASGKVMPIKPSSQWHTLYLTASFYVIDAMCIYKQLRSPPKPELPSYSLDAILNRELKLGKLKFKEADSYSGLKWHQYMQQNYKPEYVVYNVFDCLSILLLDLKTKDMSHTMPSYSDISDFDKFNSNPKKINDALYYYYLNKGKVQASTPSTDKYIELDISKEEESNEEEEEKLDILSLKGWIKTLHPYMIENLGLQVIKEDPELRTSIRGYVYDSDCISAYPRDIEACNVSKTTTKRELCNISGIEEEVFRLEGINLLEGPVNAIEYCTVMFNFPKPEELLDRLKKNTANTNNVSE